MIWTLLPLTLMLAPPQVEVLPPDPAELPSEVHCPVDRIPVGDRLFGVRWEGRRFFMDAEACQRAFLQDPERYAREWEPRAALFGPPRPDRASYGPGFLYFGIGVVLGLFTGGIASFVAIQKGLSGRAWFAAGFFLSVLGLALLSLQKSRPQMFTSSGFRKTPRTHDPVTCSRCGSFNHPSASQCSDCGAPLQPRVESELARTRLD